MRRARVSAGLFLAIGFICFGCGDDAARQGPCGVCAPNASCVTSESGQAACQCDDGYEGDASACVESVQTAECGDACDENAWCVRNADDDPVCKCKSGFAGNGRNCTPVVDAADCNGCDENAVCLQTAASVFECRCENGWVGSGKTCEPAVSCDDDHGGCHPRASCTETAGRVECACQHGFEGDGYSCVPPVGGFVKVAGQLSLDYATAGCTGNAVWNFDLRFTGEGAHFATPEPVKTGVWEAEAAVDFIDFDTGELTLDFQAHTWLEHDCPGRIDFLWANAQDAEHTWANVPVEANLAVFGEGIPWYWSANDVTVTNVTSSLVATFEK